MEGHELEKKQLETEAQKRLHEVEMQLHGMGRKTDKVSTTALLIGGALFLIYIAGRKIFKKRKQKAFSDPSLNQLMVNRPEKESFIARKIRESINVFLMTMIRERLLAFLRESDKSNESLRKTT